ncbi:MAG TPA: hypothetical protein VHB51_01945 [Candidatus Saccharimonadales bacterium]|nr:hypothetical protein [Candidatus Saccharimonadales bacterium]
MDEPKTGDAAQSPPAEPEKPAAAEQPAPSQPQDDEDALEKSESELKSGDGSTIDTTGNSPNSAGQGKEPDGKSGGLKQTLRRFNIYLLMFLFILVIAAAIILVAYFQSKKGSVEHIKTESLTQQTLEQVAASDATVGNNGQILNVQSNAVFAGQVLVRNGLEVAGNLKIGGTVALTNLTVNGTTQLGQLQVNQNLSVNGDTGIQGALTVAKSLQVNGGGTFSGNVTAPQITAGSLQINSDLTLTHHLISGGANPDRTGGPALGSGGTAAVSGSDTSGAITINTGSSPAAGCFLTVTFAHRYSSPPHIIITPVEAAAGGLDYYVTRTSSSFSICDSSAPPSAASFGFDYFVID